MLGLKRLIEGVFFRGPGPKLGPADGQLSDDTNVPKQLTEADLIKANFDSAFYLKKYQDVAAIGVDPMEHYCLYGWHEKRDPSPAFSTAFYIEQNPDVKQLGVNPYFHYLSIGRDEGRSGSPAEPIEELRGEQDAEDLLSDTLLVAPHFDAEFYLANHPEVAEPGLDPVRHYLLEGWKAGFDPSPEFSTRFYLGQNPDVRESGINPFFHYVSIGRDEGRSGTPGEFILPQPAAEAVEEVLPEMAVLAPHFDAEFYRASYPEVAAAGLEPVRHYMLEGWLAGFDPSPKFSTRFYLDSNEDVRSAGVNPFWHFLVAGIEERRPGLPPPAPEPAPKKERFVVDGRDIEYESNTVGPYFDAEFYLSTYPEVAESNLEPLHHFLLDGWQAGFDPNPEFSTKFYLERYGDVRKSGVNPFWHYVVAGRDEGRLVLPPKTTNQDNEGTAPRDLDFEIRTVGPHFDSGFYLSQYPDIAVTGLDPVMHYLRAGWKEGRDPTPDFSTAFYLENSQDIKAAGVNPFFHYIVAGREEGRACRHPGGYKVDQLIKTEPLERNVKRWLRKSGPDHLTDAKDLEEIIVGALSKDRPQLVLSVGHDHYKKISGGVQLCTHREELLAKDYGAVYLQVHPWQSLPRLSHIEEDADTILALILDGQDAGYCKASDLIQAIGNVQSDLMPVRIVIHHMLGLQPEQLAELVQASGSDACWLWLHDFFTICPSYTLQRNGVNYCGAPPLSSNACTLCRFGRERESHQLRMRAFFEAVNVNIISPSSVTLKLWNASSGHKAASTQIIPHVDLAWHKRTNRAIEESDKISIAFVGTAAPHKGWDQFVRLVRLFSGDERYRFVYFGSKKPPVRDVEHVPVHVTAEVPDAMIKAVAEHQIDLVLHWASWPETFSLSTFEALAASSYVITNAISGNVAATVRKRRRGAVLEDTADLEAFFTDGRADEMATALRADRKTREASYELSQMAFAAMFPARGNKAAAGEKLE